MRARAEATRHAPGRPPGAVPFQQFIVKVNSRCNLACRYCYMYFAADSGWRRQPVTARPATLTRTAERIAEHAAAHGLPVLSVVLHGGEPLLTDPDVLGAFVRDVRARVPEGCAVLATVQTNGVLLTEEKLTALTGHGITVGLSLDGGLAAHNAQRVDHAGRPAWPGIERAARLLADDRHRGSWAGALCVVDAATDPAEVYGSLLALAPPAVDFLLPHGNWTHPPPGLPAPPASPTPYGDWLCAVFDLWWNADRRRTRVRFFEECIALLLGLPAATESMGLQPFTAVVVETDGGIEQVDSLKSAYEGAAATGLDVFHHPFDAALDHPGVATRQSGTDALSDTCLRCPVLDVCGGGHYAHRYRAADGHDGPDRTPEAFRNPSVYCADLQRVIGHIATELHRAAV
ncbi:FxsB family cyclophane-forming radical SAM/SPASM peptide maturase [Streptomyces avicenniae]|uniref:FxsB family cyclophane-forming radical SAM/SPASM peptide maturase n=1 Tax=Streptomyces avicenniae TaxID=500153 RepID=UPI001CBA6A1E|nr:FxsB family cyclophane-forming radical SAM/SPASM peptide maturase [Streptomyces avicenniae]